MNYDSSSYIEMNVISGTTYSVQVGGLNATSGNGDLTIFVYSDPTNDYCANAIPIAEVTDLQFSTIGSKQISVNGLVFITMEMMNVIMLPPVQAGPMKD